MGWVKDKGGKVKKYEQGGKVKAATKKIKKGWESARKKEWFREATDFLGDVATAGEVSKRRLSKELEKEKAKNKAKKKPKKTYHI